MMKSRFLVPPLLVAVALMGLTGSIQPLSAQTLASDWPNPSSESTSDADGDLDLEEEASTAPKTAIRYECLRTKDNTLLTVAKTPRGPIEMVRWASLFFGKQWSPERRCHAVSDRFQTFSDSDQLKFVSTGIINNYNVLCISGEYGDCIKDGLLITLEPKDEPVEVLQGMFNYKIPITRGPAVVDIETLLDLREPIPEGTLAVENQPSTAPIAD